MTLQSYADECTCLKHRLLMSPSTQLFNKPTQLQHKLLRRTQKPIPGEDGEEERREEVWEAQGLGDPRFLDQQQWQS